MTPDLDALLTALYVEIDDHVIPSGRRRPGQPKKLSDAELVCLAVAQVLLRFDDEPADAMTWTEYRPVRSAERALIHSPARAKR